jgi:hypothetical protein
MITAGWPPRTAHEMRKTMTHHIELTDEDYAALAAAAARTGSSLKELIHQAIVARFSTPSHTAHIGSYQYPTGPLMTRQQREAMERLAQKIGSQHPWASEIVIEDRGPR